jgi:ATP-dependent Lon protease
MSRWTFPNHATRSVLLARCPRLVRLTLERHLPQPRLVDDTMQAIAALAPELAPAATAWATSWKAARTYVELPFRETTATLLSELGGFAATKDSPATAELGHLVRALSHLTEDQAAASKLAASAWSVLHTVESLALSLRCLEPDEAQVSISEAASPYAEIDVDFDLSGLALPADADAVRQAWWRDLSQAYDELRQDTRALAVGLSALAVGLVPHQHERELLASAAMPLGRELLRPVARHATQVERARVAAEREAAERQERRAAENSPSPLKAVEDPALPEGHVLVCPKFRLDGRMREIARSVEKILGVPVPLIRTPDLRAVRAALLQEYPYAQALIDRILRPLASQPYVRLPPMLLLGPPGTGKSRLARRIGELLGLGVWRIDAPRDTGGAVGGLERRWSSSEPSHVLAAIARHGHANPVIFIDEIEKAQTRTDQGRLWDTLLGLLEGETSRCFMDTALQVECDLSHAVYMATANAVGDIPTPLLDRMLVLQMPEPAAEHLEALLPSLCLAMAHEQGLDARFVPPMTAAEIADVRRHWDGGSVRRLRQVVDVVLGTRDHFEMKH